MGEREPTTGNEIESELRAIRRELEEITNILRVFFFLLLFLAFVGLMIIF